VGDEGDAGLGDCFRRGRVLLLGDVAEAETVADRDLAAQAQGAGAGTDLLDMEEAHLARLVQVNVEPDTVPCRDGKDAVELTPCSSQGQALGIAIDLQRVDAADQIGAAAHRRVEQVEDVGAAHDAALRKGDDLHAHKAAVPRATHASIRLPARKSLALKAYGEQERV
jgi:hypothetical protein